jgi:hypothetical protein
MLLEEIGHVEPDRRRVSVAGETFVVKGAVMFMVRSVVGGVDAHADFHVVAAIDANGGLLDVESFPADSADMVGLEGKVRSP